MHSHAIVFDQTRESSASNGDGQWRALDPGTLREALTMGAIVYDRVYEYAGAPDLGLDYIRRATSERREINGISDGTDRQHTRANGADPHTGPVLGAVNVAEPPPFLSASTEPVRRDWYGLRRRDVACLQRCDASTEPVR